MCVKTQIHETKKFVTYNIDGAVGPEKDSAALP
jgi:hypothetical protein